MRDPDGERDSRNDLPAALGGAILRFVGNVPASREPAHLDPTLRARAIANAARAKAALVAGSFALPPGPLGWLTVLPELLAVWRVQAQMVADIAGLYGHEVSPTREQMIYCLFRHTASQAVRDVVVRVGERALGRPAMLTALREVATRIGVRISQRELGKGLTRWVPVAGAVGVGLYAYYDTEQVARTAIGLFEPLESDDA